MDVILKQDIQEPWLCQRYCYSKRRLRPQFSDTTGLAIIANSTNRKVNAENLKQKTHKESKARNEAEALAAKLEKVSLSIGAKAATTGKIFGSVNALQIAEALKEQFDYDVTANASSSMLSQSKSLALRSHY
jgi:large subunit ribosomal protein L9